MKLFKLLMGVFFIINARGPMLAANAGDPSDDFFDSVFAADPIYDTTENSFN